MRHIRAIIIEDEAPARRILKDHLAQVDVILLEGEYDNGFDGLKAINELKPDLVFLDIQMPKLTGFEILELLEWRPQIIFTTAFDQYAVKAFEENAVDYLLKPFSEKRLKEALNKVQIRMESSSALPEYDYLVKKQDARVEAIHRIVVKTGSKIKIIYVDEIHYLEAQDDYVMIYIEDEKHLKQKTMKYFESHLPADRFIRIHRSYIVRIDRIEQIELYEKDAYRARLNAGIILPVSKSGYARLRQILNF
jgi:two-component system LytT family response regulator